MGYYIKMDLSNVKIAKENVEKALKAINDLHKDNETMKENGADGGVWTNGTEEIWYSFVGNPPAGGFVSLFNALQSWRYFGATQEDGSFVIDSFCGEKMGNDDVLWNALAPFLPNDAEIVCKGGDEATWRWIFVDEKLVTQQGKIVFE
jgi:hypothetical protein